MFPTFFGCSRLFSLKTANTDDTRRAVRTMPNIRPSADETLLVGHSACQAHEADQSQIKPAQARLRNNNTDKQEKKKNKMHQRSTNIIKIC